MKKNINFAHYHSKGLIRKRYIRIFKKSNFFLIKLYLFQQILKLVKEKNFPDQ